jgi:hypothetical protein
MLPEIFIAKNRGEEGSGPTFKLKIGARKVLAQILS